MHIYNCDSLANKAVLVYKKSA